MRIALNVALLELLSEISKSIVALNTLEFFLQTC